MKDLKIIEDCLIKGAHTPAGSKLKNVDNEIAADLVASGRAVEIPAKPEVLGNRDPESEDRDPKPSSKKDKAKEAAPAE